MAPLLMVMEKSVTWSQVTRYGAEPQLKAAWYLREPLAGEQETQILVLATALASLASSWSQTPPWGSDISSLGLSSPCCGIRGTEQMTYVSSILNTMEFLPCDRRIQ